MDMREVFILDGRRFSNMAGFMTRWSGYLPRLGSEDRPEPERL